ncbi:MAG: M20/M25/M40 family metallo-hydrolase [Gemmatimonas sp.]|nr:M20/M25/M40 family metallo-hydrolase [Gemmatimonas sp.]
MNLQAIISHPTVRNARSAIHSRDRETVNEQVRLVSIPAPTGQESERGKYVGKRFKELGLEKSHMDDVGNVVGFLRRPKARPNGASGPVLLTAHLDTVFPDGTPIEPQREGQRIRAPGITDNARGLAAMLAIAAALRETRITTEKPLVFVATVGEEGLGDLRGVKHLFGEASPFRSATAFISLDGAGITRIVNRAIGVFRWRVTVSGLGGHSWGDRGLANPLHAIGLAVAKLREIRLEDGGDFAINVGRIGGGTSVNSIPSDAWLELDLRSEDGSTLARLEGLVRVALKSAVRQEIDESTRGVPLVMKIEKIGERPSGETPADAPLVVAAVAATKLLGSTPELIASSTDANVPISLQVPAVAMGAGGLAGGVHTMDEWFENQGGPIGIERALLTVLAIAGIDQAS